MMKRVNIIGCPGSGKSTLSRVLHDVTGLPLFYLDMMNWKSDGTNVDEVLFNRRLNSVIQLDAWIIDGNYAYTLDERIRACDTVIFLDYPTDICLDGIIRRRGQKRPDLPWVEPDAIDEDFIEFVKNFQTDAKPEIMALLEKYSYKEIIILKNRGQADEFINSLI